MNDRQRLYANARLSGMRQRESAIEAGYAPATAANAATRLEKHKDVKAAMRAGKLGKTPIQRAIDSPTGEDAEDQCGLKPKYENSLAFMVDAMNNPQLSKTMRWQSAKELLPYQFGRVGEKGKKETAKDRAAEVSKGGDGGVFRPKTAPKLHSVK